MLDYNELSTSARRSKAKPLTLDEEYKVIDILNERLAAGSYKKLSSTQEKLLQRFIDHYQNVKHFYSVNSALRK